MPLQAMLAHPFVLAAVTVIAIGVITYQILQNTQREPIRGTGYGSPWSDRPGDYPGNFDKDDDDDDDDDRPGDSPGNFVKRDDDDDDDDDGGDGDDGGNGRGTACNETRSEKSSNAFSGVRKRTVATQNADTSKANNLKVNWVQLSHTHSVSNSVDANSDLASDCSVNGESQYPSQRNSEMQKAENNISQMNSNITYVANINDEDSDSPGSNNLQPQSKKAFESNIADSDSSESNNSLLNPNNSMDFDESICSVASSSSTSRSKNIRTPSSIDSFEEIYKRDVCNHLKTDIEGENNKEEKCFKDFSDEESDVSENNFSATSEESNTSCAFMKKPKLCKGCLEEFANAVAYPCKHCYLCLDCAVKVHRIFKKCTICFSVIKTFEQLRM